MSASLSVHLEAMSRYAQAMDDLAAGFGNSRAVLVEADVSQDSFGMLPESRDTAAVYAQRTDEGLGVLAVGEDVFTDLAQGFRQMRDNYHQSDLGASRRMGG